VSVTSTDSSNTPSTEENRPAWRFPGELNRLCAKINGHPA
jgi:hypothetical protein